jgi:nucleoid-associated protein YgaU
MSSRSYRGSGPTPAGREPGRVLWGRVAVAGAALLVAFLLGRASVDEGVEQARFDEAQARIAQLEQENRDLAEGRLAVAAGGIDTPPQAGAPAPAAAQPEDEGGGEDAPAPQGGGQSYTVQEGDTLASIAQRVYGDAAQASRIEQANQVDATDLQVGQTLTLPPAGGE